ncbi:MAG: aminoacyl-tRNA hydrolase [Proteobacteria bacterium]|nr:aminoacyl-tRNA hydrolase [Pseudomonadota bacterium]MBU1714084.1 aminoacyl-tRNA hydrolase [Pseudomonadota bacterium]
MSSIQITPDISLDENELEFTFVRSSGPGGQNVNKVATAVQLRFDLNKNQSLSDEVRQRLIKLAGRRVTVDSVLIINANRHRTQNLNRQDAMERLINLILKATIKQKARRRTLPTKSSKRKRLEGKKIRALTKQMRRPVSD